MYSIKTNNVIISLSLAKPVTRKNALVIYFLSLFLFVEWPDKFKMIQPRHHFRPRFFSADSTVKSTR